MKFDVLHPQRATAHGVSLILVLLVTSPKGQSIDEVERHCPLSHPHLLTLHIFYIVFSYFVNLCLQLPGLLVLLPVSSPIQTGAGVQHHVLGFTSDLLLPARQPGHCVVVLNLPLSTIWRNWYFRV